jgi:hypothetical protein
LFLGTAYAGQIEGLKKLKTWGPLPEGHAYIVLCTRCNPHPAKEPTAFSQKHVLALLVDFLFLNRYIESGAFRPHSAVARSFAGFCGGRDEAGQAIIMKSICIERLPLTVFLPIDDRARARRERSGDAVYERDDPTPR